MKCENDNNDDDDNTKVSNKINLSFYCYYSSIGTFFSVVNAMLTMLSLPSSFCIIAKALWDLETMPNQSIHNTLHTHVDLKQRKNC